MHDGYLKESVLELVNKNHTNHILRTRLYLSVQFTSINLSKAWSNYEIKAMFSVTKRNAEIQW